MFMHLHLACHLGAIDGSRGEQEQQQRPLPWLHVHDERDEDETQR